MIEDATSALDPQLDPLLDTAPAGFVSIADDGRILAVNRTLCDRLGMQPEALRGRHLETILPVGARIFYQTHFFPLVKLRGTAQEVFLLVRDAAGQDHGTLWNAVRRERDGQTVTDCVIVEVRERQRFEAALLQAKRDAEDAAGLLRERTSELERANYMLEEQAVELELQQQHLQEQAAMLEEQSAELHVANVELERQRAAAEDANRAKSNFLAVMSHELRTPLNAIAGYVQLLSMGVRGAVTESQLDALHRIDRAQRHLLGLINDVLNLSRIEAGRVDYRMEALPAAEVVSAVLPMIEPQAAAKELTLRIDVPPSLIVRADRDKLRQIVLNLLTNAVKFTPSGRDIHVFATAAGDRVHIGVRDTGIGIPPEMVARVFDPFVQVDTGHTRANEGTGLGLAISRDLARGMGGDLTAESTFGEGSTFRVTLAAGALHPAPPAPTS